MGADDRASTDQMSAEEKRHDQLTTAPKADESDANPRVAITDVGDGVKHVEVTDVAKVRPGKTTGREEKTL
jgi:hypothetical protein